MRIKRVRFILALVAWFGVSDAYGQDQSLAEFLYEIEMKYGSDADLVNGEKYFYPYAQSDGNPFLNFEAQPTSIRIRNKVFEKQLIKYDIFNQQLVLEYSDLYGGTTSLVLRQEWVESFSTENREFIKMPGPDGEAEFLQVIYDSTISCYYRWSKDYQLNLNSGVQSYYFTESVQEAYLFIGQEFFPFRNNRTFLKPFADEQRKKIKSFMRQSKVKIKKATDWQMRHIIEYCNSLTNEVS